jgi:hypothetical protein
LEGKNTVLFFAAIRFHNTPPTGFCKIIMARKASFPSVLWEYPKRTPYGGRVRERKK